MFEGRLNQLQECLTRCVVSTSAGGCSLNTALQTLATLLKTSQGITYVIGNGGSAGIASHFANDLLKTLHLPAQTLYDSNLMTCLSNDLGYEHVFSTPLERLIKPVDILVAISSSGKSPNILRAVDIALERSTAVITLSGFEEQNPLRKKGQLNFWINAADYGLVESAHFFLLHSLVDLWPQLGMTHVKDSRTFAHR